MAQAKNYNNFAEIVGNIGTIYQAPAEGKTGDMRFTVGTHRTYTKKDGTKAEETVFLNVHLAPGRRYAKQSVIAKGAFVRIKGHLENNAYQDAEGNWKGGMEIAADSVTLLKKRDDGKVENAETGEVESIEPENEE